MAPKIIQAITVDEPERPLVSITLDGRPTNYELSIREDFGLRDLTRIQRLQNRVRAIQEKDDLEVTEQDTDTIAEALDALTRLLIRDAPDDLFERLRDGHRMAIVEAWNNFMQASVQETEPTPANRATRRTGTSSSPRSSASTAASRKAG